MAAVSVAEGRDWGRGRGRLRQKPNQKTLVNWFSRAARQQGECAGASAPGSETNHINHFSYFAATSIHCAI